jgi:hypothetical protein
MATNKTCFTCMHCKSWGYAGSLEEPPESGWECGLEGSDEEMDEIFMEYEHENGEIDERVADKCPYYEYYEPIEEEPLYDPLLTAEEIDELASVKSKADEEYLISIGHLDPVTGEPTDAYYRAADFAYDSWREKR